MFAIFTNNIYVCVGCVGGGQKGREGLKVSITQNPISIINIVCPNLGLPDFNKKAKKHPITAWASCLDTM